MNQVLRTALFAGALFLVSVFVFWLTGGRVDLTTLLVIGAVVLSATVVVTLIEKSRRGRRQHRP
ncbi:MULTISPECIES: hypothetical protein [unclassified Microbacterium]|uniref:hypothetical protein n=1 Tax=Microbacterium TaxID=33882 RepID=UPI003B9F62BC